MEKLSLNLDHNTIFEVSKCLTTALLKELVNYVWSITEKSFRCVSLSCRVFVMAFKGPREKPLRGLDK
jgi:hypothetical protein